MSSLSGIVLVGGLGARSRSVFLSGPKSMALVGSRPFLEYLLAKLRADGITDVVLCVGYRRSQVQQHFHKGSKWGLTLRYSVEEEILGSAGAIKKAARMIDSEDIFVFSGDSLVGLDPQEMWDFHHEHRALATMALVSSPRANRYGRILTDESGQIIALRPKFSGADEVDSRAGLVNAGTYLLGRQFIEMIPDGRPVSIEMEMFPKVAGYGLHGFVTKSYFININVPDDLARAQHELPTRQRA